MNMIKMVAFTANFAAMSFSHSYAATKTIDVGTVYTNSASYLAAKTAIEVPDGAAFDFRTVRNSSWYGYLYQITIAGDGPDGLGALRDTGTLDPKGDDPQITTITLSDDALIKSSHYMALLNQGYAPTYLNLNNHTLTIDMDDGKNFAMFDIGSWNTVGQVRLINGGILVPNAGYKNVYRHSDLERATFSIEGPGSTLTVQGEPGTGLYVKNLLMSDSAKLVGNGFIGINGGTFRPSETDPAFSGFLRIWGNIMIDLSELDGAWKFPAYEFYNCTSSTITLKIAPWATEGTGPRKIVKWSEPPKYVAFQMETSAALSNWRLVTLADGLYLYPADFTFYAARDVPTSSWKFYTLDRTDVTATCGLSEPTAEQAVCFGSEAEYEALKQLTFSAREVLMWSCTLDGDTALAGLDFTIDARGTVDVAGHKLSMPATACTGAGGTVTSSVSGGVLELSVPVGQTSTINSLSLTGGNKLQLWKTGEGRLVMAKPGQTFGARDAVSCVVKKGVLAKRNATSAYFGTQYSIVRVEDGAQVDIMGGMYWDYDYHISGDGPDGKGAIVCGETITMSYEKSTTYAHLRNIVLDGDAAVGGDKRWALSFYNNGTHSITFNGHTFTVGKDDFVYWINLNPLDGGKLVAGNVEVYQTSPNFANVDVEVETCLASCAGNFFNPVKSLKYGPEARWYVSGGATNSPTVVYETYRPGRGEMPTVTLGAEGHLSPTLDLSTQTNALDGAKLLFADGAMVTVDLGSRKLKSLERIVDWSASAPPNLGTLKFNGVYADGTAAKLQKSADGLYMQRKGMMILVR